ncbi:MAG TPA: vWA domain-containing protein, partial [Armatimonadota bacterium]|nr:vWA domain-containing protein [Armatimonadota bacterium]
MKTRALILALALAGLCISVHVSTGADAPAAGVPDTARVTPSQPKPVATQPVDLAICLDTSGSMSGLIDSAKQKLWAVVNELASATPAPDLRVGLIQYGNDGLDPTTGWVERKLGLTSDLDEVYNQLFALTTNGGQEYVARAITLARESMEWSADPRALKIVFVCGNEPATQDPEITVSQACEAAIAHDIIVNSIYCGPPQSDEALGWQEVAKLADGEYGAI